MTLSQRDQKVLWHPFTQHAISGETHPIVSGKGAYLVDHEGKSYLDLISSWWVNLHGHSHPNISKAIYEQAQQLEHVLFAGFTHEPAVALAENLLALVNNQFNKVFYSDNGSTSVEVALKMAYQYWRNIGQPQRTQFIAFKNGYHGDTFGAMAVGKQSHFFSHFEDLFFKVNFFSYPETWIDDSGIDLKESAALNELKDYLDQHGERTAALIIEPLVQGSSGMRMCRSVFLRELEKLVCSYGVLIIYDEVMTGLGRIGSDLFAFRKAKTQPDILCISKGLTGGFLPLAATLCKQKIFDAFLGQTFSKALVHGHTFTANPLACAAALASMKLLKQESTLHVITCISKVHEICLTQLQENIKTIEHVRFCGTIAAFDLQTDSEYGSNISIQLRGQFLKQGLLIRPLGNVIYLIPPYCITNDELYHTYEVIQKELEGVIA